MKKRILIAILLVSNFVFNLCAQDQTINGNLTVNRAITSEEDMNVGISVADKMGLGTKLHFKGTTFNTDGIWMAKYAKDVDKTDLRLNIGDGVDFQDRFVIGTSQWDTGKWLEYFVVRMDGRVGINVSEPTCALDVNGTIRSKEVKIEATGWADFVFDEDYKLPKLSEVENHIKAHKHLPDLPSEKQVVEEGINVVEMQAKLLQKIEELTLYVIEQDKEIKALKEENKEIKQQLNKQ